MTDEHDITLDEMLDPEAERATEPPPADQPVDERYEDDPDFDEDVEAAPRRGVGWITRGLVAGILLALAFTGGVLIQKHHDAQTSAGSLPAFSGGFPGFNSTPAGGSGSGSQGNSSTPAVIGTVVSVHGNRVIVRDLSGKRHVVETTDATTITRSTEITASKLTAGTTVVVVGTQSGDGTTSATAVTVR